MKGGKGATGDWIVTGYLLLASGTWGWLVGFSPTPLSDVIRLFGEDQPLSNPGPLAIVLGAVTLASYVLGRVSAAIGWRFVFSGVLAKDRIFCFEQFLDFLEDDEISLRILRLIDADDEHRCPRCLQEKGTQAQCTHRYRRSYRSGRYAHAATRRVSRVWAWIRANNWHTWTFLRDRRDAPSSFLRRLSWAGFLSAWFMVAVNLATVLTTSTTTDFSFWICIPALLLLSGSFISYAEYLGSLRFLIRDTAVALQMVARWREDERSSGSSPVAARDLGTTNRSPFQR